MSNKNVDLEEENNKTLIREFYTKNKFLRSENIRLHKQVRKLKYCLRHIPKVHKTPKKDKEKKSIKKSDK